MNQLINQIVLQIVVVLASLDEQVCLDVRLHLLHRGDEVIVPPVHLNYIVVFTFSSFQKLSLLYYLVLPARPRRVRNAGAKALGKLSHKVVVDSVFHRAQDYHRSARSKCSHVSRHELGG